MPQPRRSLPAGRPEIPWTELRRRSTIVFLWLQAGWTTLTTDEREDARRLLVKSRGRPGNLTKAEARRLGRIAGKAAAGAAAATRRR